MHKRALYYEQKCKVLDHGLKGARTLNAKYATMCKAFQEQNKALVSNCKAQEALYTENEAKLQKHIETRGRTIAEFEEKHKAMKDDYDAAVAALKTDFQRAVNDKNAKIYMLNNQLRKLQTQSQDINPNIPHQLQKVGTALMFSALKLLLALFVSLSSKVNCMGCSLYM